MIRGLYTAIAGMIVQQKRQENVSNNLANVETPSFRKQMMTVKSQNDIMMNRRISGVSQDIGALSTGPSISDQVTDFGQGMLISSGRDNDYAIDGDGFYKIVDTFGEQGYSRNGRFNVNGFGELVNSQGHYIMGMNLSTGLNEAIQLQGTDFQISAEGVLSDQQGNRLYDLNVVTFEDQSVLETRGNGVYLTNPTNEVLAGEYQIRQGYKENSNVDALDEMVKMMEISRAFESNQRVVQSLDETLSKAVNELGKV